MKRPRRALATLWWTARPPLSDPRFWVVQLLTVLINVAIAMLRGRWLSGLPASVGEPMIDVANLLFLVPVIYAALNFGLIGSVATAVFVAVFRGTYLLVWHDLVQLWVLAAVYATVLAVAIVVGERVEREVRARRNAEAASRAARAAEAQVRRLFDAYAASVVRGQEEERSRIAKELHDEPLQQVVQLCHQLDRAAADANGERPALVAARGVAEGIADELRRLASGLRPPALDELGLAAALRMVARELQQRTPALRVDVVIRGRERRLDPAVELNLFRIAQEALRNAERHAEAAEVSVRLAYEPGRARLTIADDGRGLPADGGDGAQENGRLGLVGMRERARLLGGELQVVSGAGAGTRVEVSVQSP